MSRFLLCIFVVYLKLAYAKSGFLDNAATANADFTPCSQNTSTATLRIVLVIDTSTNMGSTNLRQIGLSLSSELSKYTISNKTLDTVCADTFCWNASNSVSYNSNVAIVTYSDTYTLVGDFSDFASNADVNSALLSLKPSSSDSVNGLVGALKLAYNLSDVYDAVPFKKSLAVLWFPASVKNLTLFEVAIGGRTAMYREELVAVNYNPNDRNLTNMLNQLEIPYIFNKTQPNIYDHIHWALLQLNCQCGFNIEFQPKVYNNKINQWEKTADCFVFKATEDDTKFCQNHPEIAIDSYVKFSAMQEAGHAYNITSAILGLHKNNNNQWMWYDYNGGEFQMNNFTKWAPNQPSSGDCVIAKTLDNQGTSPYLWYTMPCNLAHSSTDTCQVLACDASRQWFCGLGRYY